MRLSVRIVRAWLVIARAWLVAVLAAGLLGLPAQPAGATDPFHTVVGFATKTGFRLVFAWEAAARVSGVVEYGLSPSELTRQAFPQSRAPDTAQIAITDIPRRPGNSEIGRTFWFRIRDTLTGAVSATRPVGAHNAWHDYDPGTRAYTVNLLVQLDAESLPSGLPADQSIDEIAAGTNILAERIYDAFDGRARIGRVLITDTLLDNAVNVPAASPASVGCTTTGANLADVLVQTSVPFDSHTFIPGIDDPCTQVHLGRTGWLIVPWIRDLDFGYTFAHELLHYAFNAPDLYVGGADCDEKSWNGSIMHNSGGFQIDSKTRQGRWLLTELDRNQQLTPCEMGDQPNSWGKARERYPLLPDDPAVQPGDVTRARGNPDGGALQIFVLDRSAAGSTLRAFSPNDN